MRRLTRRAGLAMTFLAGLGWAAPLLAADPPEDPPVNRPSKSVRGKLESLDKGLGGVLMITDDGKQMAWRFSPPVVAEVAKMPLKAPMIVIYRQIALNEKRVTAVAFPGTADKPTYVNLTGERIVLRSAAIVGDSCSNPREGPVHESIVGAGSRAEVADACWCCAPYGETCTPGNKSGVGLAFLDRCFE